ncbi:MAG: nucleotidyl transferase AbiEii/AbiGii toxin family protein [Candidatus Helarchaeota archaeon]
MITKEELKAYAKLRRLNLGQAERDYFQYILLFFIFQEFGNNLIFKGGTALNKCYGLDRFSEDLDFTGKDKFKTIRIESGLKRFGINYEVETEEYENTMKIILRIRGPLFSGIRHSLCNLIIDISFREHVILKPKIKKIGRFLEEIPAFEVLVMQEQEILAEKVRAIFTRNKASDIYDLWHLLEKGIRINTKLINKKLECYNEEWSLEKLKKEIDKIEKTWQVELRSLVPHVPNYGEVRKNIFKIIGN